MSHVPGFIRDPLFIDVLVHPWQNPHHLSCSCAYHNITSNCIHDINGFRLSEKISTCIYYADFGNKDKVSAI